jgi:hypothetical protein
MPSTFTLTKEDYEKAKAGFAECGIVWDVAENDKGDVEVTVIGGYVAAVERVLAGEEQPKETPDNGGIKRPNGAGGEPTDEQLTF